jgi:hypothetical protein
VARTFCPALTFEMAIVLVPDSRTLVFPLKEFAVHEVARSSGAMPPWTFPG